MSSDERSGELGKAWHKSGSGEKQWLVMSG
jgi:hypothetical protein